MQQTLGLTQIYVHVEKYSVYGGMRCNMAILYKKVINIIKKIYLTIFSKNGSRNTSRIVI